MTALDRVKEWYRSTFQPLVWLLVAGGAAVVLYGSGQAAATEVVAIGIIASLASVICGLALGFLFGVPRRIEGQADGRPGYAVNTNLEEVSDWLTKAIVGIGLVELGNLAAGFANLSRILGSALGGGEAGVGVAGGIMVFFVPAGFLGGYLWARTIFLRALTDLDNIVQTPVAEPIADIGNQVRFKAGLVGAAQEERASGGEAVENREPLLDVPAPVVDQVSDLSTLWHRIEGSLVRLAGPVGDRVQAVDDVITVLRRRGVLDEPTVAALHKLAEATKEVSSGAVLSENDSAAVRAAGADTLAALDRLRRFAPAAFEQHVLTQLRAVAGPDWVIEFDAQREGQDGRPFPIDAVVRRGDREVVVEVKVPASRSRWVKLVGWLRRAPANQPVLLVLPDHAADVRALAGDQGLGTLRVLEWDTQADQLGEVLREMLEAA
jgi:hypothetical protein